MRLLSRARVAVVMLAGQMLLLPAAAGAIPIAFEFTGVLTQVGVYAPQLAVGDPFTAVLSYDTDAQPVTNNGVTSLYTSGFVLELHAGGFTWGTPGRLMVWHDGSRFLGQDIGLGDTNFVLDGPGVVPTGGGLPAVLNLSAATGQHIVFGQVHTATSTLTDDSVFGSITGIRQTQVPAPVPEPAALTLSALGLATLAARRRLRARG